LQVYANTLVASVLIESLLSPVAITWTSTNPMAPSVSQPFSVTAIA
jgi:hypothetical protein